MEKQPPVKPDDKSSIPEDLVRVAPDGHEGVYPFDLSQSRDQEQEPTGTSHEEENDD